MRKAAILMARRTLNRNGAGRHTRGELAELARTVPERSKSETSRLSGVTPRT
jgi:hypothetical protein